jgi:hypothetical protein
MAHSPAMATVAARNPKPVRLKSLPFRIGTVRCPVDRPSIGADNDNGFSLRRKTREAQMMGCHIIG